MALFGGSAPGGRSWEDTLAILGAILQDTGSAYNGRPGNSVAGLKNEFKRLGDEKKYRDSLGAMFGAPEINPVMSTPLAPAAAAMMGQPDDIAGRAAAKANDRQSMMFSGPLGQKLGADTSSMLLPLLQNADPESGMSMMAKLALDTGKGTEYSTEPRFTQDGRAYLVGKDGSVKYLDGNVTPRERVDIAGNGVAYNPFATKPGTTFNDPNKAFGINPDGQLAPNTPFQNYEINKAKSGRASTTVNVGAERPFSQALGGSAASVLEASSAAARGGAQTIGTVNQIRQALDTGKVTAGPGTTAIQFFGQISGGDPQRLQATRATMQGLAKLTLDARGALKGQGTITDREQALLERAVSGDIDNLSLPEIRTVTDVAERAARAAIKANQENVQRARQVPGAGPVLDFFAVPEPANAPQAGAGIDDLVNKYLGSR